MPRSTVPVLDANNTQVQATLYPPGREAAADSFSVALSNEDRASLGATTDAAAAAAGTGDYSLIAGLKRSLLNWASLLGRIPASLGSKAASGAFATVATPFEPIPGSTVSYSCSTTALSAQACTAGEVLRFGNANSLAIGIRFGDNTVAASITAATAMDIMPGTAETFTVPGSATHWSAIMASGTGTLKTTRGAGA